MSRKAAAALDQLTAHAADAYADIAQISEKSGIPEEKAGDCFAGELSPFLVEK